jgi:hypothetical protein
LQKFNPISQRRVRYLFTLYCLLGDDEYGVDINRNFDFMWGERSGASHIACDSDYHGESAESEPETQALAKYARDLFPKGQRKDDPEGDMNVPFGEENTGEILRGHCAGWSPSKPVQSLAELTPTPDYT